MAVSQLSNVLGAWQPLPALLAMAKAHNALTVIDGAQGVVHGRHDVRHWVATSMCFPATSSMAPMAWACWAQ
jgi:selenocysteine lyase/cysteine desulfurase